LQPGYYDADEFAFGLVLSLDGLQRVGIWPGSVRGRAAPLVLSWTRV
jgi:hypothetical protein